MTSSILEAITGANLGKASLLLIQLQPGGFTLQKVDMRTETFDLLPIDIKLTVRRPRRQRQSVDLHMKRDTMRRKWTGTGESQAETGMTQSRQTTGTQTGQS